MINHTLTEIDGDWYFKEDSIERISLED